MAKNPTQFAERVAYLYSHPGEISRDEIELKDGTIFDRYSSPVVGKDGTYYGRIWAFRDITQRKKMEEEVKGLPKRIIQAQEQECDRIARDLHDDLGQSLATLKMIIQSTWLQDGTAANPSKEHKKILDYLDTIIDKSRNLAMRLRPATLEALGLTTSINLMCDEINRAGKVKISFLHSNLENLHFESGTINVFRIVQEGLTNILKYAKASRVKISLKVVKDRLRIKIEDNGCGFVLKDKSKGLGLITMTERTSLLGGVIDIQSELKKGTTILVDIPCGKDK